MSSCEILVTNIEIYFILYSKFFYLKYVLVIIILSLQILIPCKISISFNNKQKIKYLCSKALRFYIVFNYPFA